MFKLVLGKAEEPEIKLPTEAKDSALLSSRDAGLLEPPERPVDGGNLISGSSAFPKTSLNIRKFMVHILLKTGLENFVFSCLTWRAIPGPLSKLHRSIDSL